MKISLIRLKLIYDKMKGIIGYKTTAYISFKVARVVFTGVTLKLT